MTFLRVRTALLSLALFVTLPIVGWPVRAQEQQPTAIPAAPTGLKYFVNGSLISILWTPQSENYTRWIIEAGGSPGTTFFSFDTIQVANAGLLTQLIPGFTAVGPPGNYYVRVRAANADGVSGPSNEILMPITGGCQPPGPPTQLGAIVRGNYGLLQWNIGQGGIPSFYVLQARFTPTGPLVAVIQTGSRFINVPSIPSGSYYLEVYAVNGCGQSGISNQILVTAPGNTPVRTPNPAPGERLPLPYVADLVQAYANERPDLFFGASCADPNVRYVTNPFLNFVVDRLRTWDQRFGYNSKPTRGPAQNGGQPVVAAGDEIAYHYGSDAPEGSSNTYAIDIIFNHCGARPEITWRDFTGSEFARWTGAGRF